VLLLAGGGFEGTESNGRRVHARRVTPVNLDFTGRALLPRAENRERLLLQAWQAPRSNALLGSGYSVPISLLGSAIQQAPMAHAGDLVITEFMKDPSAVSDSHGEWIELHNNKSWRLDIEGVTVSDFGGASFTLSNGGLGILLAPGQRYVLGNDSIELTNGGVPVDYAWSGFSLKNSNDEILLYAVNGNLIDAVVYDDGHRWPDTSGMSISLSHPVLDPTMNNDPSMWCHSTSVMGPGLDTGTPGLINEICP
jgi:hypothetical protein